MFSATLVRTIAVVCPLVALGISAEGLAQGSYTAFVQTTDFSGEWAEINHGVGPYSTPLQGDYTGLPLNGAARMRADSHDPADWSIPELQCRPHPGPFNWLYGGGAHITKEVDPASRELVAYHMQFLRSQDRAIYLDGRPHPPEWAPHTWEGFSTARFDGLMLVVTTTHLKESYLRSNGVMFSDKSRVTEYLTVDGDLLTITAILEDPVYLEEPYIRSVTYRREPYKELQYFPCTVSVENVAPGVPHFLPGKNPYLNEFAEKLGLPLDAARGGAETTYPEYRKTLKTAKPSK